MKSTTSDLPKTILIVEDESALAEVLAETLKKAGYQVTAVLNGDEGLREALINHPTLILLDILMPIKNGITMLKELRKIQKPPFSKVLFFTNLNEMDTIADAVREGAEGYIVKAETSLEEIVARVNSFFSGNKAADK